MPRITNNMMTNTTLINIMRNQRKLDSIIRQIETTKRVQKPSDNPIVASRALKFRANVAASEQYLGNIRFGQAWQDVSEASLMDITKNIMPLLHELAAYGANGTLQHTDKLALVAQIRELAAQIGLDMNKDYAGRYAFSGLRTDEPALFIEDNKRSYVITQQFDMRDIEKTKSFQKLSDTDPAIVHDINIIKLAYNNVNFNFTMTYTDKSGVAIPIIPGLESTAVPPLAYDIVAKSITDADAYTPPTTGSGAAGSPHVVHYIKETGELVFTDAAAATFKDGTTVTYNKEGFKKGELNPLVYFDAIAVVGKEPPPFTVALSLWAPAVNGNGEFNFGVDRTVSGILPPGIDPADSYPMINGAPTSPVITIGVQSFHLWSLPQPIPQYAYTDPDDPTYRGWENTYSVYKQANGTFSAAPSGERVDIIQRVYIEGQEYKIAYSVVNRTKETVDFDLRHAIDTELENDDNLTCSGGGSAYTLTDSTKTPTMAGTIAIANNPAKTTVTIAVSGSPADSDYAAVWRVNNPLKEEETVTMTTTYGVKNLLLESSILTAGEKYTMEDQLLYVECAAHTLLPVNTLAKDIYTDNMYADLKRLTEFAESLTLSDPGTLEKYYLAQGLNPAQAKAAAEKQISDETAQLNAVLQDRFNNILYLLDRHGAQASKSHSAYGSLMFRFELMLNRTEEDEAAYTKLMSQNEDTDLEKAIMLKAVAEAAYAASLRASTNLVNLTLANFLN